MSVTVLLTILSWVGGRAIAPTPPRGQPLTCEDARLKCAYRTGCGMALQNYLLGCTEVMSGQSTTCPDYCQKSLIALTSTDEGRDLMNCKCGDEFCETTKRRLDVCRPQVMHATHESTVVTCTIAQWICAADPPCALALEYYHRNCRSMFHGKKCSHRCNNSLAILQRQEKAAKLASCECDGTEDYDCRAIRTNMDVLCFRKFEAIEEKTNVIVEDDTRPSGCQERTISAATLVTAVVVSAVFTGT